VKNGEPVIQGGDEDDEDADQEEIMAVLTRQPSRRMSRIGTMMKMKKEGDQSSMIESLISSTPEQILGTGSAEMVVNTNAPKEVQQVVLTYNYEMKQQAEAANRELELLRLRHIQDLEEAKAAGVSDTVLVRLREEHEDELRLMQEQNQLLKEELMKQRERDEAQALLTSAITATHHDQDTVAPTGLHAVEIQKDNARISEMVTHLQETCQNKDEVLVRLFDLINLREAEIHDYEVNQQAIATAQADDSLTLLQDARSEMLNLRNEVSKKDSELARLKHMMSMAGLQVPVSPTTRIPASPSQERTFLQVDDRYQQPSPSFSNAVGGARPRSPATPTTGSGQYNQPPRATVPLSPSGMGRGLSPSSRPPSSPGGQSYNQSSGGFLPNQQYKAGLSSNQQQQFNQQQQPTGLSPNQKFGQQPNVSPNRPRSPGTAFSPSSQFGAKPGSSPTQQYGQQYGQQQYGQGGYR
jgi:hypothetical protein